MAQGIPLRNEIVGLPAATATAVGASVAVMSDSGQLERVCRG